MEHQEPRLLSETETMAALEGSKLFYPSNVGKSSNTPTMFLQKEDGEFEHVRISPVSIPC